MLGRKIIDVSGVEGQPANVAGLGLLDVVTEMEPEKHLADIQAEHLASGVMLEGYEIHMGRTTGPDCKRAWLAIGDRHEGAMSPDGRVQGCYLHGMFASDRFRALWLREIGGESSGLAFSAEIEATLDRLAEHLERHVDLDLLLTLAE